MRIEARPVPLQLPDLGDLPPLLTRLYAARGVRSGVELERGLKHLLPYDQLRGIEAAVAVLREALERRQSILVVGDFDADGATATSVAVLALRALGAARVDYLVPNRFEYGYGLTPEIVEVARQYQPDVLLTVDNGISSLEGVQAARAAGMRVVVTDHHLPGAQLPEADAIVNPSQPECTFPSKAIAGVGVVFYLMLALRAELRQAGWFSQPQRAEPNPAEPSPVEPNLAELLDLVALGTVADVVPLDANNRILVHQGLARIRSGRCRPGIRALLQVAGRPPERLVAADLGFIVGPRLNAAGRLDDMSFGIECLLAEDEASALEMAQALDGLNQDRKAIERDMQQQALAALEATSLEDNELPFGLCLFQPDWHQGVIGILASRLKERYHRPVIAFADAGEGLLKGSARSIPGLHVRDALDAVAARHPGLISKFGGHAMAAGLSLPQTHYADFCAAFDAEVRRHLCAEDLAGRLLSDGELAPEEFCLELATHLREAGPWGQHFPAPGFHGEFAVLQQRLVGQRHLKLALQRDGCPDILDGIAFNIDAERWPDPGIRRVLAAFTLDVNEYRGRRSLQLLVSHLQPV